MKVKITMADSKIIVGERRLLDIFLDGWGTTVLHNYEITTENGTLVSKGSKARVKNSWVVIEEGN